MSTDLHAQARTLLDRGDAPGISPAEQAWLHEHLRQCDPCRRYAELTARAIQGLSSFSFSVDPGLAARTQAALTRRAQQMEAERARRSMYLRGFALACLFTVIGSLLAWPGWAYIAGRAQLAPWEWQLGFSLFWVLPSASIAMLLLVGMALGNGRSNVRSLA